MNGFLLVASLFSADFPICSTADDQKNPVLIFASNQYYIFWVDMPRTLPIYSLYGARVSATGTVLDPNGKVLFQDSVFNPRVAFDGANLMVVWREGC